MSKLMNLSGSTSSLPEEEDQWTATCTFLFPDTQLFGIHQLLALTLLEYF